MALFRCTDKIIIGEVQRRGEVSEILAYIISKSFRVNALVFCRFLNLLAMLIGSGEEHDIKPVQTLEPRQHITGQRCIGMPDMWLVIHIVNRCGEVIGRFHAGQSGGLSNL